MTPKDNQERTFSTILKKGYDPEEVDVFLDEITKEMRQLEETSAAEEKEARVLRVHVHDLVEECQELKRTQDITAVPGERELRLSQIREEVQRLTAEYADLEQYQGAGEIPSPAAQRIFAQPAPVASGAPTGYSAVGQNMYESPDWQGENAPFSPQVQSLYYAGPQLSPPGSWQEYPAPQQAAPFAAGSARKLDGTGAGRHEKQPG